MRERVWAFGLAAMVAVMMGCLVTAVVTFAAVIAPSWDGTYLVPVCMAITVEAFLSNYLYRRYAFFIYGGFRFRLAEWGVLFLLFIFLTDLVRGIPLFQSGVPRFDGGMLALGLPLLLCWQVATDLARSLDEVRGVERHPQWVPGTDGSDPRKMGTPVRPGTRVQTDEKSGEVMRLQARREVAVHMMWIFYGGGFALFVLAGLSQVQNERLMHTPRTDFAGPIVNVLVYFVLGIVLLALVHQSLEESRWKVEGSVPAPSLPARWVRYAAAFLAVAGVLAFLLPTEYVNLLLNTARSGFGSLLTAIATDLANFFSHLGLVSQPANRHVLPPHPVKPLHPPAGAGRHPPSHINIGNQNWFFLVRAVLFWLAIAVLTVVLVRQYLREGRSLADAPPVVRRVAGFLVRLWKALRRRLGGVLQTVGEAVPGGMPVLEQVGAAARRLPLRRLQRLSPRQRVLYYFRSTVRRAERQGMQRPRSQTALEFDAQVAPRLAEAGADLHGLTQAYLEARYSTHPIEGPQEAVAREHWRRIRDAMQRLKRQG